MTTIKKLYKKKSRLYTNYWRARECFYNCTDERVATFYMNVMLDIAAKLKACRSRILTFELKSSHTF